MVEQSPLFQVIAPSISEAYSLRLVHSSPVASAGGMASMSISLAKVSQSHAVYVDSIEEAEDRVFALARNLELPESHGHNLKLHQAFLCRLNQASAMVAKSSRRGAGNRVFIHPHHLNRLKYGGFIEKELETVGRWQKYQGGNGCSYNFYVSPSIPVHQAYVAYVSPSNTGDGPAVLARNGQGYDLVPLVAGSGMPGQAADYMRKVDLYWYLTIRQFSHTGLILFC